MASGWGRDTGSKVTSRRAVTLLTERLEWVGRIINRKEVPSDIAMNNKEGSFTRIRGLLVKVFFSIL